LKITINKGEKQNGRSRTLDLQNDPTGSDQLCPQLAVPGRQHPGRSAA
jgi:hypothetical protein